MKKIIISILLLIISGLAVAFFGVGNHGHFMFRPHMTEDWVIWSIAVLTGSSGLYILTRHFLLSRKSK